MARRLVSITPLLWGALACGDSGDLALATVRPTRRAPDAAADPLADSARTLVQAGYPWRASLLLAPALADTGLRTPQVTLAAAEAAAAWNGWREVSELLTPVRWLDAVDGGAGHVLLARAALERPWSPGTIDSSALAHAERALALSPSPLERTRRLVLVARARERAGSLGAAAEAYRRAAAARADLRDWLMLRAAAIAPDEGDRRRAYGALRSDVAKERAPIVEAMARSLAGDVEGAARTFTTAGRGLDALRVRLERGTDADRDGIRPALLASATRSGSDASTAIALLDRYFAPLTPDEQLRIARGGGATAARAATAYAEAARAHPLAPADHAARGAILARLGRWSESAREYALAASDPALAPDARHQRARALLRTGGGAGSRELQRVADDFPGTPAAANALFFLGDMADDAGNDAVARRRFLHAARTAPSASIAPRATMRAAIIAFAAGDIRSAARELDSLGAIAGHEERSAARYWSGRAREALGDAKGARARWADVMRDDPTSYYTVLAARRLGVATWRPAEAPPPATIDEVERALRRATALDSLGFDVESALERDRVARLADSSAARLVATAESFRRAGLAQRGIHLALRAWNRGAPPDEALFRNLHPFAFEEIVRTESARRGLEAELVAALIRQESNFFPEATSRVGARGLMQVMPAVGGAMAKARRFPMWDAALLWQPDVSVQLGTAHLASEMGRYGSVERVLAAYNAGGARVRRWARKAGANDPELFVERIPFVETRDYVRIVLRNRALYRAMYGR